jgi:hypothetical protein
MGGSRVVLGVLLSSLLCLHGSVGAQEGKQTQPEQADSAATQKAARDALAWFEKPAKARPATTQKWRLHMECLITLAKAGPATVPVLLDALKTGSPDSRALAA